MSTCTVLLLAAVGADLFGNAAGLETTYSGRLTPVAVAEGNAAEKGFSVTWSLLADENHPDGERANVGSSPALFLLTEDTAAQPWPARFGFCDAGDTADDGPRIGYRFNDRDHTVALPAPVVTNIETLQSDRQVLDGPTRHSVVDEKTILGRDCLIVETSTNLGRDATTAVEKSTGLIVLCEKKIVLGRGDRFQLTLELANVTPLDAAGATSHGRIAEILNGVAETIEQGERDAAADLPTASLDALTEQIEALTEASEGTAFAPLATAIERGISEQRTRAKGVDELAQKIVDSPAPALELNDLDGQPLDADLLKDKIVVLHFWDYDRDMLEAPYGQVGYLDFLHRRRSPEGIAVIGVATNPAFGNADGRRKAARSARDLADFMNLGYPLASDDGSLLARFGDPRPLGAPLPLWVVVDGKGVVRIFKSGLYEVRPNDGLKELDTGVTNLLQKEKSQAE